MNKKLIADYQPLSQLSPDAQVAVEAVLTAAQALNQINLHNHVTTKQSGVNDFATAWDIEGQQHIIDTIHRYFPDDPILGEESDLLIPQPQNLDRVWVIDPIDGTANARAGRRYSFISLGFIQAGISEVGVVFDPYHHELFYAQKNQGAWKNQTPINISSTSDFSSASVMTDMGFINEVSDLHQTMMSHFGSPSRRMLGSAIGEMLEVATGQADLFFYTTIKPWDNAATFCILNQAGAAIKGLDGREIGFTSMDVVTGHPHLVNHFISQVSKPLLSEIKTVQQTFLEKNPDLKPVVSGI